MESEEAMLSVKEQVETEYEQIVSGNLNTLRRLSKTGQPVDQGDRDIIRFLVLVALGHFYEGSA